MSDEVVWLDTAVAGDQCLVGGGNYTHGTNAFRDEEDFLQMCRECHGYAPESIEPGVLDVVTLREDGLWVNEEGYLCRILDPATVKYVGKTKEVSDENDD